jgi:hypothetical protein
VFELLFKHTYPASKDLAFAPIPNTTPETALRGRRKRGLRERLSQESFNGVMVPLCLGKKEDKYLHANRTRGGPETMTDLFPREYEPHGNQSSKAPPRNPEIFPRNITGRTDGTWDPLIHGRKVFGPSTVWIGFLRMILLPSFPFPGRVSNRNIVLIHGKSHGNSPPRR